MPEHSAPRPTGASHGGGLLVALVALTVVSVALGVWGFLALDDGVDRDFLDALHLSLQLVVLNGEFPTTGLPVQLEVARLLAPLAGAAAVLQALLLVFRDRLDVLRARRGRDHVVVAGLGSYGSRLAAAFLRDRRVVAIERDPTSPAVAAARDAGVPVVVGDATQAAALIRAGVERARHLVVTCGDDATNVEVAFAACARPRRRAILTSLVELDDLRLWGPLKTRALTLGHTGHRLEFFNVHDAAGRILLDRHPPFPVNGDRSAHVVLVGLDGAGEMLLLHLARLWALRPVHGERLRTTIAARDADRRLARLSAAHPRLPALLDLQVAGDDADAPALQLDALLATPPSAVYVSLEPEGDAAAAAMSLAARLPPRAAPVVVLVPDARSGLLATLQRSPGALEGLVTFGIVDNAVPPELLLRGTNEVLARAKHEQYVQADRARGVDPAENPSLAPWAELPESLKASNRAFADRIGPKLDAAGWAIVPDPLVDPAAVDVRFPPDQLEALARAEHDEWCDALLRDGWRHGPSKDPENRIHPLLVPWAKLDETARDKDREAIAGIPRMLAEAGFRVFRATPAA